MDVTEISVMVHEKRNHPYEYGHYDCEVRLSAHLGPDENVDEAAMALRDRAASQVRLHLDGWIDGIETSRERRMPFLHERCEVNDGQERFAEQVGEA